MSSIVSSSSSSKGPLTDSSVSSKRPDPCILVIFGATGDLTARKLVPALYNLALTGQLPPHFVCVGFARRTKTNEQFRQEMMEAVSQFSRTKPLDQAFWDSFSQSIFYHCSNFDEDNGYDQLAQLLHSLEMQYGTKGNRLYYLSAQPSYFPVIVEMLKKHHLIYDEAHVQDKWSRIIIEKPFGHDLASAVDLQHEISKHLNESQVYRIDHYLGKETVQNLLVFRFCNSIFEAVWNNHYIDHVQISVSEELGIGTRGHFFEEAGMLRDIVQNHMMQVLSLVCMEPPTSLQANAIRDEKVKVMQSIRPLTQEPLTEQAVRGQYGPGFINGTEVPGYRQENFVSPASNVETYVALKLHIDNWRWTGVPFYLRAGKRLPKRTTEIAIIFKDVPGYLFSSSSNKAIDPNVLVIRIQPDEGMSLKMNCKVPGLTSPIQPVKMDFRYGSYFGQSPPEAYERLICDCMAGDSTLFARGDEVLASWKLLDPVIQAWQQTLAADFPNYVSGSWGPDAADTLIQNDGRQWRLL